jgi:hypothetical protein
VSAARLLWGEDPPQLPLAVAFQLRRIAGWRNLAMASVAVPVVIIGTLILSGAVKQALSAWSAS